MPTDTSSSGQPDEAVRIREWLGDDALAYLLKKHAGGVSGAKGVRYEDVFAVVQVAESARSKGQACSDVRLEAQVPLCFVDDLCVTDTAVPHRRYFQLKNSPGASWFSGQGSLACDCVQQEQLCRLKGETGTDLVIVTSDRKAAQRLKDTMPDGLKGFTRVMWFPWEVSLPLLCEKWIAEFSALAWLSKHAEPTFHDVVEVLGVLCGAWIRHGGSVTAHQVFEAARSSSPTLIRPLVPDDEAVHALRDDFKVAIAGVENFSYSVVKGFFAWEMRHANGTMTSGVLSHDCFSDQFKALQSRVVKLAPLTFESMEDQLL